MVRVKVHKYAVYSTASDYSVCDLLCPICGVTSTLTVIPVGNHKCASCSNMIVSVDKLMNSTISRLGAFVDRLTTPKNIFRTLSVIP